MKNKKKIFSRFSYTIFTSLILHGLIFLFIFSQKAIFSQNKTIEEKNLVFFEYPIHQQIVHQNHFNNKKTKTRFLSKKDNAIEKQTQAMLKGLFQKTNVKPSTQQKRPQANKLTPKQNTQNITDRQISSSSVLVNKIEEPIKASIGNISQLDKTIDFLPQIPLGSNTLLNTKEFAYYSYFSRMKEQLYWRWIQYFKTEFSHISTDFFKNNNKKLFSTILYVYLNSEGEIQDIRTVHSSGSKDIDMAAFHAFMSAEPFPNPPESLVEADGFIHIKQSFHLYISPSSFENLFSKK